MIKINHFFPFVEERDGKLIFDPADEKEAYYIYNLIKDYEDWLNDKIELERIYLIIPRSDESLNFGKDLIDVLTIRLTNIKRMYDVIQLWFSKNNLPVPGSPSYEEKTKEENRAKQEFMNGIEEEYKRRKGLLAEDGRFSEEEGSSTSKNIFRKKGDFWQVTYKGHEYNIVHTLGMDYISFLLRNQGQSFSVMKFSAAISNGTTEITMTLKNLPDKEFEEIYGLTKDNIDDVKAMDRKTIRQVGERLRSLKIQLVKAKEKNDASKINKLSDEINLIVEYLSKSIGIGGKVRILGSKSIRESRRIRKNIDTALTNIAKKVNLYLII